MKASKYLYIVPFDEGRTIIFYGINNMFMLLDQTTFESIALILQNPNSFIDTHSKTINLLKSYGFLIDDDTNELEILRSERESFVNSLQYKSTIVSTYNCNYNCWYCIQKHAKEEIDYSKIDLIIKHVKNYLTENGIKSYILSWFGGEPLMEPEVIDYVSSELLSFCKEKGIEFNGAITTNGSLLKQNIIDLLLKNEIYCYQITIDGDRENHDKTKRQDGEISSFDTILSNIVTLLNSSENVEMNLRFNYTSKSLKSNMLIDDINAIIPSILRNRITVDFQKVWQVDELGIPLRDLSAMLKKFHESGYKINSNHVFSICYVDKVHHNTIFYNGGVDKCDSRNLDNLRGYIDPTGHIVW